MASQRGKDFGMGDMLKVVVVLSDELALERGWDDDARGDIGGLEDGEAIDGSERVGVQFLEKSRGRLLCVFPFVEGGG